VYWHQPGYDFLGCHLPSRCLGYLLLLLLLLLLCHFPWVVHHCAM
jgi:hypothetical protein